jgi:hypothetical protein
LIANAIAITKSFAQCSCIDACLSPWKTECPSDFAVVRQLQTIIESCSHSAFLQEPKLAARAAVARPRLGSGATTTVKNSEKEETRTVASVAQSRENGRTSAARTGTISSGSRHNKTQEIFKSRCHNPAKSSR